MRYLSCFFFKKKHLLLFLGFLINLFFFSLFYTSTKADECSSKRPGDSCGAYIKINSTNCQTCYGTCSSQLTCVSGSSDYCSSPYTCNAGTITPTPSIVSTITPTVTVTITPTPTTNPAPVQSGNLLTGVQVPDVDSINRLVPSQYSFQWAKFQFSLGSTQPLESWISGAGSAIAGGGRNYGVLISIAKNRGGIEALKNPPYPELDANGMPAYTQKYCPWDNELDSYDIGTGEFYECGTDSTGKPKYCERTKTITIPARTDNGYVKFRDQMRDIASRLQNVGAVEIWNEPNYVPEWTAEGLGPVSPENYANFLICGIKGLKAGGYQGIIISAALAPNTGNTGGNMDDFTFFNRFYSAYYGSTGSRENSHGDDISAFGWHANVTENLPPNNTSDTGFQRFSRILLNRGKPIWLTEFGWDRKNFPGSDDDKRQLQAHYISQAYDVIKNKFPSVSAMFVWNFGFTRAGQTADEFVYWDIEGTIPQGIFCQPNVPILPKYRKDRGNTNYVQDKSLTDDVIVATVAGQALIPKAVIDDANKILQKNQQYLLGTNVDARKSFLDNIPGLNFILQLLARFGIQFCGFLGFTDEFCKPNISVGALEKELGDGRLAPGKNIPKFASDAKILGKTAIPQSLTPTPEIKDCNIGKLSTANDPGNKNINDLSEMMGTTTGFYGNNMPNFKTLTPNDWETTIKDQLQKDNLNIGNKLFNQDRRSPDMYLRKQVFCKGNYPNGICPFEPSPSPSPTR